MNSSQQAKVDLLGLTEFVKQYPITVMPIELYCKIFFDTPEAIKKRIQRGTWQTGVHVHKPNGQNKLWVDLKGVERWVKQMNS